MRLPLFRTALGVWSLALWPNLALAQTVVPSAQSSSNAPASNPSAAPAEQGSVPSEAATPGSGAPTSESPAEASAVATSAVESQPAPVAPTDAGTQSVSEPPARVDGDASIATVDSATATEPRLPDDAPSTSSKETLGDDEPTVTKKPEVEVGLRVIGGFRYRKRELDEDATYGFQARQMRASLKLKLGKRLYTRLSAEFTDGISPGAGVRFLRTAVLEYRQSKALRLALGRFKRPFSYLQLQSAADLPVLDRGLLNELVVEDSAWGDRGIGAMASGKIKALGVGWALSFTNPSPDSITTQGLDVIARLTWSPNDLFTIGVNGGNKYLDLDVGRNHFQAVGGDVTLTVAGLEWQLEGTVADRPWQQTTVAFGATSLLSYTHRLSKNWQVQPVLFAEYADANAEFGRNESVRLQGGINAIVRDQLRIMPQYKLTAPLGDALLSAPMSSPQYNAINPWSEGYELSLLISLVL